MPILVKKTRSLLTANKISIIVFLLLACTFTQKHATGEENYNRTVNRYLYRLKDLTVIGKPTSHTVQPEDTFLDIAREYELGYNDMTILYPQTDPWMPPAGEKLIIPAAWVIPHPKPGKIVINIPELRLYFFEKERPFVQTYPISIGGEEWKTPVGTFSITEKRFNPTWYVPESLQEKYEMSVMPPGPENPLGKYVMRFSESSYSIHGTHRPWGVGRLISHGCIRCYPEHICLLYPQVGLGTEVEIIYEPVKFGQKEGRLFVEIHPDVYGKIPDFEQYAAAKLKNYRFTGRVDPIRYDSAVRLRNGVPTDITISIKGGSRHLIKTKSSPTEAKSLLEAYEENAGANKSRLSEICP